MSQSIKYRADRRLNLGKFDNILNFAVIGLLAIGTLLVWAALLFFTPEAISLHNSH